MANVKSGKGKNDSEEMANQAQAIESKITQKEADELSKALCVGPMPGFEIVEEDLFSEYGSDQSVVLDQTCVLTPEIIEEAAKKAIERFGYYDPYFDNELKKIIDKVKKS